MKNEYPVIDKATNIITMLGQNYNVTMQQMLQLLLIKGNSFNFFDGEKIFNDLVTNREVWESVALLPYVSLYSGDLIEKQRGKMLTTYPDLFVRPLINMPDNYVSYDYLYILVKPDKVKKLKQIAKKWEYDEFEEVPFKDNRAFKVFQLWWD